MKTKIQSGLAAMLLFIVFSCSKDNASTNGNNSSRVSSSESSYAVASSNDDAPVSIVGSWVLYYDWDCNGGPGASVTDFYADGTWSNDQGYTGLYITGKHMLVFTFDNSETTYSGIVGVKEVHGIQSTFEYAGSLSGCFHMDPNTGSVAKQKDGNIDANGKSK